MDLFGYVAMPVKKNDRVYLFAVPLNVPFQEAREVLSEYQIAIDQLEESHKKAQEEKEAQAQKEAEEKGE